LFFLPNTKYIIIRTIAIATAIGHNKLAINTGERSNVVFIVRYVSLANTPQMYNENKSKDRMYVVI
jgi:hypothetical protein